MQTFASFFLRNILNAVRRRVAAVVEALFERAWFPVNPLRGRMERGKPLGQLRAEKRERRHAQKRRQVPWTGIVSNKNTVLIDDRE